MKTNRRSRLVSSILAIPSLITLSFAEPTFVANVSEYDPKGDVVDLNTRLNTNVPFRSFNLNDLKNKGVGGLIARSTTGSGDNLYQNYKGLKILDYDRRFKDFMKIADSANMRFGAYHLLRPGEDPKKQANYFLKYIGEAYREAKPKQSKVLLVLDAGFSSVPGRVAKADGRDPAKVRQRVTEDEVIAFLKEIEKQTGVLPFFYPEGGASYTEIPNWSAASRALLKRCPLWTASYRNKNPLNARPNLPWKTWSLHQYAAPIYRDKGYYYAAAPGLPLIKRQRNFIPVELSRWEPSLQNPFSLWDKHCVDASKLK